MGSESVEGDATTVSNLSEELFSFGGLGAAYPNSSASKVMLSYELERLSIKENRDMGKKNCGCAKKTCAKSLGSAGGKKGGPARARALSPQERKSIASKAGRVRKK